MKAIGLAIEFIAKVIGLAIGIALGQWFYYRFIH